MRFAEDYFAINPHWQKNRGELDQLKEDAAAITVPSCPFCGGEAVVKLGTIYRENFVLSVACSSCGIQTQNRITGQMWTGKTITLSDALVQAAELWSRRV